MTAPGVRVWYAEAARLSGGDPSAVARRLAWLLPSERARYERFVHDADRMLFLAGRVMARLLVGRLIGCDPLAWRWREGPHGRPEIDEPEVRAHFNLAHSAGLVACALSPDREVGVDVEDRQRRRVDRRFVVRYCAPDEVADIAAQPDDRWHDRFLIYWTLKEAYLKARGLGVSVQLSSVSFSLEDASPRVSFLDKLSTCDTRWRFQLHHPTERHLMAVAVPAAGGPAPPIEFLPFDWALVPEL